MGRTSITRSRWYVYLVVPSRFRELTARPVCPSVCDMQIDLQLAKQGFRLAAWLNVLFDGATNLP